MAGTSPQVTESDGVASQSRSEPNESSRKTPAQTTAHPRTREGRDSSAAGPKTVIRPDSLFDANDSSEDDTSNNLSEQSIYNSSLSDLVQEYRAENDTHDHGDYSSVPPFTTDIDEPQAISVEYEEQYDRRMGKGSWGRRRHVKSHYVRPHPFTKTASVKKELRRAAVNPRDAFKEADADAERNSGHVFWDFTNCRIAVSLARFCWKTSPAAAWLEELLRTPSQPDIEMDAEDDSEIDTDEDSEIDPDGDSETDATRDARCQGYCTHDGRRDVPPQPCQRMF